MVARVFGGMCAACSVMTLVWCSPGREDGVAAKTLVSVLERYSSRIATLHYYCEYKNTRDELRRWCAMHALTIRRVEKLEKSGRTSPPTSEYIISYILTTQANLVIMFVSSRKEADDIEEAMESARQANVTQTVRTVIYVLPDEA